MSAIAHRGMAICNPISSAKLDDVIEFAELAPGSRVLDLGCGKAELLLRLVERYGVTAEGVDRSGRFIAEGREAVAARVPAADLLLHERDVAGFPRTPETYDLAACVGATWLLGGYCGALWGLAGLVRSGGLVLIGEGYWRHDPCPAYLKALAARRDEFSDHASNVGAGSAEGLVPLYACVASRDDWDRYEGRWSGNLERHAAMHPEDPDRDALTTAARAGRERYLRWGRDTLGFGLYLFLRP